MTVRKKKKKLKRKTSKNIVIELIESLIPTIESQFRYILILNL